MKSRIVIKKVKFNIKICIKLNWIRDLFKQQIASNYGNASQKRQGDKAQKKWQDTPYLIYTS